MKAVIEKNDTYKVTGERGDFFIAENNKGKVKMFVKAQVSLVEVDDMPKVKIYKQSIVKKDRDSNDFNRRLHTALEAEHGRTGSLEFLKTL